MGTSADEVRRDIERTRAEMGQTLDAIGDRVSPKRMVERKTSGLRNGFRSVRETVMGAADTTTGAVSGAAGSVGGAAGSVGSAAGSAVGTVGDVAGSVGSGVASAAGSAVDAVREAPQMARTQAQGNPLAAGVVAFGAGLLVSSLLPKTRIEQQQAQMVMDKLEPVKEMAVEAGQELKDNVAHVAAEHANEVLDVVSEAGQQVKDQAAGVVEGVAEETRSVAEQTRSAVNPQS